MTVHMLYKGTVTSITETAISFDLDVPYGRDKSASFNFDSADPAARRFATGDRVVWWPIWSVQITELTWSGGFGQDMSRLVRVADLLPAELEDVDRRIELELENDRNQAEYNARISAEG